MAENDPKKLKSKILQNIKKQSKATPGGIADKNEYQKGPSDNQYTKEGVKDPLRDISQQEISRKTQR